MTGSFIEIKDLVFYRGKRCIFDHVNISIPRGKVTAVMGPSGTGKTTLLHLIGAQIKPDQGEILVDGKNLHTLSRKELYQARREMGMLFQSGGLFSNLTVFENVAFPLRHHTNLSEAMLRDLVLIKLEAVGLRGARHLMTTELSGGMRRRVALARAIALDPLLMMYDEPFSGQDPINLGVLTQLIKRLNHVLGMTSVVVSHSVAEAAEIADHVYIISDGQVITSGDPKALMQDESPKVKQFVHGLPDGPVPYHFPAKTFEEDLLL